MKPETYNEKFKKSGFTIIEVAVSVFVLAVAVIGVYSAFSIVVILTLDNSDRFTAAYLAQEGIEIIRNIRDANWVAGNDWRYGLPDFENGCEADYISGGVTPWPSGGNYLRVNDENGFYSYNPLGTETKFKRKIKISTISDPSAPDGIMKVSVEVSWDKKATIFNSTEDAGACLESNCIILEEYMYNWY